MSFDQKRGTLDNLSAARNLLTQGFQRIFPHVGRKSHANTIAIMLVLRNSSWNKGRMKEARICITPSNREISAI